jgi:hypothetical protein
MNIPTLQESLILIWNLPSDVPAHLVSLLGWLRFHQDADGIVQDDNETIAHNLHIDRSSVVRAFQWEKQNLSVLDCVYTYKKGDAVIRSNEPPNSPMKPHGRFMGRECKVKWDVLKQFHVARRLTVNRLNTDSLAAHFGGSPCTFGREGMGIETKSATDEAGAHATPSSNPVVTLAVSALNHLFLEAQQLRGITKPIDIVHGQKSESALSQFIAKMPSQGRWTPWERTVNLFSFWVERHSFEKLKDPLRAFIQNAPQFGSDLGLWEQTSVERFRELPKPAPEPWTNDPEVTEIFTHVYQKTHVSLNRTIIWYALQKLSAEKIKVAVSHHLECGLGGSVAQGSRDIKTTMQKFFVEGGIDAALTEIRVNAEQEQERLEAQAKRDAEQAALDQAAAEKAAAEKLAKDQRERAERERQSLEYQQAQERRRQEYLQEYSAKEQDKLKKVQWLADAVQHILNDEDTGTAWFNETDSVGIRVHENPHKDNDAAWAAAERELDQAYEQRKSNDSARTNCGDDSIGAQMIS